ncbi:hypothetical protein GCM10027578_31930 [Spirosoma luteolum]
MLLIDAANISGGGAVLLRYLAGQLQARGLPFHVLKKPSVPIDLPANLYTDLTVGLRNRGEVLQAAIDRHQPDTLLCFGNFPPPFKADIRTVTYFHNLHYLNGHDRRSFRLRDRIKRNLRRAYLTAYQHHTDWFVVQTPYVRRLFLDTFSVDPARVVVFPFYNEEAIRAVAVPDEADPVAFLYASSPEPHKNHVTLLRAWALLHQQGLTPTLHLTVAPDSPYTTPALLNQISQLQQQGVRIVNHGQMTYETLLQLTASCGTCVFPSVNETIGLGLLEAYWLGSAILAADRPYLDDVVTPTARFDPYDPAALARAVQMQLTDPGPPPRLQIGNQIVPFIDWLYPARPADTNAADAIWFHDTIAARFDSRYEASRAFGERYRVWTALFDRYVAPTDHVLDLGCGSGIFSSYLAGRAASVTGVDGSAEMIRLCHQKPQAANLRYVQQRLPLADPAGFNGKDVVIASSLLEYIDDLPALLTQMHALLRPGGLLIVSMPNRTSGYRRLERHLFSLTGFPRYFAHIRHVATPDTFAQLLQRFEFEAIETAYFSSYDPLSRLLKPVAPRPYVNNLFVGVYRRSTVAPVSQSTQPSVLPAALAQPVDRL